MDTPIINPMIFYAIEVINHFKTIFNSLFVICSVFLIVKASLCIFRYYERKNTLEAERYLHNTTELINKENFKKNLEEYNEELQKIKKLAIIPMILIILSSLIPSEKIMYKMLISHYVTIENIQIIENRINDIADYLIKN